MFFLIIYKIASLSSKNKDKYLTMHNKIVNIELWHQLYCGLQATVYLQVAQVIVHLKFGKLCILNKKMLAIHFKLNNNKNIYNLVRLIIIIFNKKFECMLIFVSAESSDMEKGTIIFEHSTCLKLRPSIP